MQSAQTYLTLSPECFLKMLEIPCIYDRASDDLYELDDEACGFVKSLPIAADSSVLDSANSDFLDYCLKEGILCYSNELVSRGIQEQGPIPSLRYLLLHITARCNLKCAHCFLGDPEPVDMPLNQIVQTMQEFEKNQGLRLLVSGGEPLLHPQFWELNKLFSNFQFRTVILSNGIYFGDKALAKRLRASEVQVSLDGVGDSHEILRGPGTYEKSLKGLENLVKSNIDVSIATMIHEANLKDFDALEKVIHDVGAKEWNIDVPAGAGRWSPNKESAPHGKLLSSILDRSFGGGAHYSADGDWSCGAHLCAVMADGTISKCGFYANAPSGHISEGLAEGWKNIPRTKLASLHCDCDVIEQCRGGCRYRAEVAGDRLGKDPVMCAANGLPR